MSYARSVIKSVQRGITTIAAGSSSLPVTISGVDMSKSLVNLVGFRGESVATGTDNIYPRITLASSTTLGFARVGTTGNLYVSWEVIEYV